MRDYVRWGSGRFLGSRIVIAKDVSCEGHGGSASLLRGGWQEFGEYLEGWFGGVVFE
ncbi:MAG: hypothetical protein ACRD3K_14985 [Edaphobacter sp.]